MRIAVVGSRSVSVAVALPIIRSFFKSGQWSWSSVVSGGARGVDSAAAVFARSTGLPLSVFLPDYSRFGRVAPFVRNRAIVVSSDALFCVFAGHDLVGGSRHVVSLARSAGIPVVLFSVSAGSFVPLSSVFSR